MQTETCVVKAILVLHKGIPKPKTKLHISDAIRETSEHVKSLPFTAVPVATAVWCLQRLTGHDPNVVSVIQSLKERLPETTVTTQIESMTKGPGRGQEGLLIKTGGGNTIALSHTTRSKIKTALQLVAQHKAK